VPTPSWAFRSLWHIWSARSGSRGLCLPATFRPQGLATLATAYSLANLAGLVSCRQRLWDFPFGAFSSAEASRRHPPVRAPACRYRKPTPDQTEVWSSWRLATRLPGTSSSRIPRGRLRAFSPQRRRMLPWAFSLSRDFTMALADFLGSTSSRRLIVRHGCPHRTIVRFGVSIDHRLA